MRRIGVFDSGIGGLTVLRRLRAAFPRLDMVYLGDLARVPYGGRSVETITRYAADDVEFLLRRDVEAVVIACGTVSSNSLETLRDRYGLPIFGVIDSAARSPGGERRARGRYCGGDRVRTLFGRIPGSGSGPAHLGLHSLPGIPPGL